MRKHVVWLALLLLCSSPSPGAAQELIPNPTPTDSAVAAAEYAPPGKHFARTAIEVFGVNATIWAFDRYIREGGTNTGFRIGINSWHENLLNGFEWDDNNFATNQFLHPYHGSMYFCSARANGYDYWESIPFAFAGSAMWEYFGETHHPSVNDWVATSVGGASVGEMLVRFSNEALDNRTTGTERTIREIGGLLINPMGGINRMITGEWSRVGPNPPSRDFGFTGTLRAGARITAEGNWNTNDTTRFFVRLRGIMGNPTTQEIRHPYDGFSVDLQLNFNDESLLGRGQMLGVLRSWQIRQGKREHTKTFLAAVHNWDYIDTRAYKFGDQSVGLGVFHNWHGKNIEGAFSGGVIADWIILGATTSDYGSYTGRSYDYGPGASLRAFLLYFHPRFRLIAESDGYYLRIVNGTAARHFIADTRFTGSVALSRKFSLGSEYAIINSERHYRDFPDVSNRNLKLTIYLALNL